MDFSLPKKDILRSKRDIDALFAAGTSVTRFPLKAYYRLRTGSGSVRMMVSVPKRNFKRAVKRNLLKRRLRESYRTRKGYLEGRSVDVMFFYNSKEVLDSAVIRTEVEEVLRTLTEKMSGQ